MNALGRHVYTLEIVILDLRRSQWLILTCSRAVKPTFFYAVVSIREHH